MTTAPPMTEMQRLENWLDQRLFYLRMYASDRSAYAALADLKDGLSAVNREHAEAQRMQTSFEKEHPTHYPRTETALAGNNDLSHSPSATGPEGAVALDEAMEWLRLAGKFNYADYPNHPPVILSHIAALEARNKEHEERWALAQADFDRGDEIMADNDRLTDERDSLRRELTAIQEVAANPLSIQKVRDKLGPLSLWTKQGFEDEVNRRTADLRQRLEAARAQHSDLLYQVVQKVPGESRHETAKRIIAQHEHQTHGPALAAMPKGES